METPDSSTLPGVSKYQRQCTVESIALMGLAGLPHSWASRSVAPISHPSSLVIMVSSSWDNRLDAGAPCLGTDLSSEGIRPQHIPLQRMLIALQQPGVYFPRRLASRFRDCASEHPLRRAAWRARALALRRPAGPMPAYLLGTTGFYTAV
jgi:hypothetical protein